MSEERLLDTFVELADTLIDDFDVIDFLHLLVNRCVELLNVDAAGLLLSDPAGSLQLVATSSEEVRVLELFQLQDTAGGPCLDAVRTGELVSHADLTSAEVEWPRFVEVATAAGFRAVDAMPLRLRNQVIGGLNLFRAQPGTLDERSLRTAQALVDVATIGLLQERSLRRQEVLTEQLQSALNSRVIIEQAKGLVAERLGVDMEGAFAALRGFARQHNRKLSEVATAVIAGRTGTHDLLGTPRPAKDSTKDSTNQP